ncbi:MAG TPA: anti-sigma factor [Planctomycetes bacterium]|nr:anti-sigma factor [Planctomycetota bacterium]HIL35917.1 anti-sigma factor [Planctomycetota bacterium]
MQRVPFLLGLTAGVLSGWIGFCLCCCGDSDTESGDNLPSNSTPLAEQPRVSSTDAAPQLGSDPEELLTEQQEQWRLREQNLLDELDQAYQRYENAVLSMIPRSARDQLDERLAAGAADKQLTLAPAGDGTAVNGKGEVWWFSKGQQGFLRVEGLGNLDPGHWTYQVWLVDGARPEEGPVSCGTLVAIPGLANVVLLQPMVVVQDPTQAMITVEKAGGVVHSLLQRVALSSQ